MDPNETLRLYCEARKRALSLMDGEAIFACEAFAEANEHMTELVRWLRRGGYAPDWSAMDDAWEADAQKIITRYRELVTVNGTREAVAGAEVAEIFDEVIETANHMGYVFDDEDTALWDRLWTRTSEMVEEFKGQYGLR